MTEKIEVDVAIIGAGTAGMKALRQVRDAGKTFVLIERGELGTMCARVGCIPSKAVLHASDLMAAVSGQYGNHAPQVSEIANRLWLAARKTRDESVEAMARETRDLAGNGLLLGDARVTGTNELDVGGVIVRATAIVIATGSAPIVPEKWSALGSGILTTDSLFDLDELPSSIGVIGLGAIGLEMGVALSRLGVRVTGADQGNVIGAIRDPEIAAAARRQIGLEMTLWLDAPVELKRHASGFFALESGDTQQRRAEVECVLVALGRRAALSGLGLENAGIEVNEHGKVEFDPQTMRIGNSSFYIAGDVDDDRPLQHEAADEGSIAGWNAARHESNNAWQRRVPLSIAFTNPDIAAIGRPFDELPAGTLVVDGKGDDNARSGIVGQNENKLRLYVEPHSGKLLGAALFCGAGEHLAHLLAWAVQREETVEGLLRMPFYHPTVEELVQTGLRNAASKLGNANGVELAPASRE
ncbi:dihydrolipoamide dehydrogenase [Paraburkholderia sp. GAS199]|uniref:dihydrolipoyl dehydrogenase n=1 Tax=Paraburkholderia sp. GAS199 TaxID=3035126 RepID=UPI003D1EC299